MPMRLDLATDCAGVAIVLYEVAHARPGIMSADQLDGLVLAVMAHEGMVVLVPEYSELEVVVVWDIKPLLRSSMPSSDRDHFSVEGVGSCVAETGSCR